jgi:hypothetical protein
MDHHGLTDALRDQDGVVSRRQLRAFGAAPHDVRRMLRRRELNLVHPGVYVGHNGPLSWQQRAQAAVLVHWPAALTRESALPAPPLNAPIQVAVDLRRTVAPVPGVDAHRTAHFDERVQWLRSPPRIRLEHAVLDLASEAPDEMSAFRLLADACQTRETTPRLLLRALAERPRVARRRWLHGLLTDLDLGACSVLERGYLTAVERAHGLPRGERQAVARVAGRTAYRDVLYRRYATVVELDGHAFHGSAYARDRDRERDLVAAAETDLLTVRLTYGQVFGKPCRTAEQVGAVLHRRGWPGRPSPCPDCS